MAASNRSSLEPGLANCPVKIVSGVVFAPFCKTPCAPCAVFLFARQILASCFDRYR